jgi:hypothetical protein
MLMFQGKGGWCAFASNQPVFKSQLLGGLAFCSIGPGLGALFFRDLTSTWLYQVNAFDGFQLFQTLLSQWFPFGVAFAVDCLVFGPFVVPIQFLCWQFLCSEYIWFCSLSRFGCPCWCLFAFSSVSSWSIGVSIGGSSG